MRGATLSSVSSGAKSGAGTLAWMAPEQLAGGRATEASDVYSFGMTVYELLSRRRPYQDADASVLAGLIRGGERPQLPLRAAIAANEDPHLGRVVALMEAAWVAAPAARPTFGQIVLKLTDLQNAALEAAEAAEAALAAPTSAAAGPTRSAALYAGAAAVAIADVRIEAA